MVALLKLLPKTRNFKPKKRYHHGGLKAALIKEGLKQLEKQGIDQLSLRELARKCNVSQSAPYRHFKDKEALLATLSAEGFRRLTATLEGIPHEEDTEKTLRKIGQLYVEFATAYPNLFRLMYGDEIIDKQQYEELHDASEEAYDTMVKAVEAHIMKTKSGLYPPIATVALWSCFHGMTALLMDKHIPHDADSKNLFAKYITQILVKGLS